MDMPAEDRFPTVYIVVLHWKDYVHTRRCLQSLQEITYPNHRIVVVDNGSGNGSVSQLQSEFSDCEFLLNESNLGFARGCNVGMRHAHEFGANYVLLLNNDMEVVPSFLQPAVQAAEADRAVGLVTGKILFKPPDCRIWHAGGRIDPIRGQAVTRGLRQVDRGQYDFPCETRWASGAMMLVKRLVMDTVGLLPEEYFFGQEEWDYSTAVRKTGYKIWYVPAFVAYHDVGASYKAGHPILIAYNAARNKQIYQEKYLPKHVFEAWRLFYRLYLQYAWPWRARRGSASDSEYRIRVEAARLAFHDHKGIRRVELADLTDVACRLGSSASWLEGGDSEE
jgi:GT2 family glycosyltransferase